MATCPKCFVEYDNGEIISITDEPIDELVEAGVGFCVMCSTAKGNEPSL